MKSIKQIWAVILLVLATSVANAQWVEMPRTGMSGDNTDARFNNTQKVIDGTSEILIMGTSDGLFKFDYTAKTWSRYGIGLEGRPIRCISFGSVGNFVTSNGYLYKYDKVSGDWDTVFANIPDATINLGDADAAHGVFQYTMKGKNRLFVTRWGGVDNLGWGIVYSDNEGITWNNFNTTGTEQGVIGQLLNRVTQPIHAFDSEGRIYIASKNFVHISGDGGDSWTSRRGNYNTNNSVNIRAMIVGEFDSKEYLMIATDRPYGSAWDFGTSLVGDSVGAVWVGGQTAGASSAGAGLVSYAGQYLFNAPSNVAPRISLDNGLTWETFDANLPRIAGGTPNRGRFGLNQIGDSLVFILSPNHVDAPNGFYVFDLTQLKSTRLRFSVAGTDNQPLANAKIEFNGKTAYTNGAGLVTLYGLTDSVNAALKVSSTGLITLDTNITFNSGDVLNVQLKAVQNQTITVAPISNKLASDAPFNVSATATSGLPVSLSIVSGPATISGSTITLTGDTGTVRVKAVQAGNTFYNAAPDVEVSFAVSKTAQTITIESIQDKLQTAVPFNVVASASSGLAVTLSIVSGPASISGNTISLTGETGTVVVRGTQAGNAEYAPAANVEVSFEVTAALSFAQSTTDNQNVLHPNPATDRIYLPAGATDVMVMTASGNPVHVLISGRSVEVSGLNPGLYFVKTASGTYKFMKK